MKVLNPNRTGRPIYTPSVCPALASSNGDPVRRTPVATYAYVNPVIAVLLGTLILNERLTRAMLAGGVLIVGAVILVVRRSPPPH